MRELLRDTAFGKLVRIASSNWLLPYPEECDSSIASDYSDSATEAGALEPNASILEPNGLETIMSQASGRSRRGSIYTSGHGNEKSIINPQNWGFGKKLLVSSLIWVLTFAIYIGSAIYSPGIPGVAEEFGGMESVP
ncbi:hypothetical protein BO99DRAFT_430466 [Aspergillus violaceofuscus CBS 115571]|uniref:Uncharacterized protein n=1 Tax=Aspergillus violaceofuscus (strain CBS 115571) TaxID=1450538 RepID=A0A2V5HBA0_ASPV1|nr:hypothetical protein BO99DRAFT_430466 [Aspergillus violaceofuscus CBS 115571]